MLKVVAVTILYNPDNNICDNIISYLPYADVLIIADNSATKEIPDSLLRNDKVVYLHDGENRGIAERLNEAAKIAKEKGYEWLLTMDQDSCFEQVQIEKYFSYVDDYAYKEQVAIFGVEFEKKQPEEKVIAEEVNYLITSGSLVNLNLFDTIGKFDEKLFIDEVDLEYCFRAITKGYKIIKLPFIFLNHNLGEKGNYRSLKNLKTTQRALHSSLRIYYMVRNFLYVQKKYPNQFLLEDKERKNTLINRIKNNLLYGNTRLLTLRLIKKGFRDFKKGKMGKIK